MPATLILEALDMLVPALVISVHIFGKLSRETFKLLFRVWLVGLICGFGWELSGSGGVWEYPNYSFYIYDGIPLALPFAWAWWFMICFLISQRLVRVIKDVRGAKPISYYLSGVWFANIESLAVVIGWWKYTYTPWFSLPWPIVSIISGSPVHIMVFLGWGILTLLSFLIAIPVFDRLRRKWNGKIGYLLIVPIAASAGILAWFAVGILTWVLGILARTIVPF